MKSIDAARPDDIRPLPANPQAENHEAMEAAFSAAPANNLLPVKVRVDYLRATGSSTLANITIQFENRDLALEFSNGAQRSSVKTFGRITTAAMQPVTEFEKPLQTSVTPEMLPQFTRNRSLVQQSLPLAPGNYRLRIVAKDTLSGNMGNYEAALDVPGFGADTLSAGSLIIADSIEKLPARSIITGPFAIADSKVRPRPGKVFTADEKLGIYLQLYNFRPDDRTGKPNGSVQYEIYKAGSNEKVLDFSEEVARLPDASASQVTIQRLVPLKIFAPGAYTLRVKATDRNANQAVQREETFTID